MRKSKEFIANYAGQEIKRQENVYEPGDIVWVQTQGKCGRFKKAIIPMQLRVRRQEWWETNQYCPVYYDLEDVQASELVGQSCTGNWHFADIFETKEDCVRDIVSFLIEDIVWLEKQKKLTRNEARRLNEFRKMLIVWNDRLKEK